MDVWTDNYKIHSYEVDVSGRATMPALCRFMQESAWNHAEHLEFGYSHLANQGLIWILSRQVVEVTEYPRWGETVTVQTWPSGKERVFCYRDFRILSGSQKVLATAATTWFAIDLKSRRPQPAHRFFDYDVPADCETVFRERPAKVTLENPLETSENFLSRFHDLDVNGHVNNVRYLEWLLDSMSAEFLSSRRLVRLEINYLGEAVCGDLVSAGLRQNGPSEFRHVLRRDEDGRELCRARTVWRG